MDKLQLQQLLDDGYSIYDIAKQFNKSFTATKYWVNKYGLKSKYNNFQNTAKGEKIKRGGGLFNGDLSHLDYFKWNEDQKKAYSYILGFYLGDGCVYQTRETSQSKTLMIANQASFVEMNNLITHSLQLLFPNKTIKHYYRKNSDCVNIKVHAMSLDELFLSGKGVKHTRKIELKEWQDNICKQYPKDFIKGLIESDGCRFQPVKKYEYTVYQFANASKDIHSILQKFCDILEIEYTFRTRLYKQPSKNATMFLTCFNKKKAFETLESFIGKKS